MRAILQFFNRVIGDAVVWYAGFKDGIEQPEDLTSGLTFEDQALSEKYDRGANAGQRLGNAIHGRGWRTDSELP